MGARLREMSAGFRETSAGLRENIERPVVTLPHNSRAGPRAFRGARLEALRGPQMPHGSGSCAAHI